ncbi:hypothetical protein FA95DRAFT_1207336 [Auriscalpium vulgare]|uniref:Uncharacterized protein n=1 Tax=Auriscalpium vulgare TaxID=40419 RepID=A0ACB8RVG3_9AGAM|nr:hypothetical protein FA95DRAFT_1207336 [Auriscalpium vulgare]
MMDPFELRGFITMDIFCNHLAPSKIPHPFTDPDPATLSALGCAYWSLHGVQCLGEPKEKNPTSDFDSERFTAQLATAWDGIYHWSTFFLELFPQMTPEERRTVHQLITRTVSGIRRPAQEYMVATDGIAELAARLWLKEIPTDAHSTTLAWRLLDSDTSLLQQFVEVAGSPARIARVALSHLHAVLKDRDCPALIICHHLHTLCSLTWQWDPMPSAIVDQRGVSLVTRTAVALANRRDHEEPTVRRAVSLAFSLLCFIADAGNTPRRLKRFVREGLLHAYIPLFPVLDLYRTKEQEQIVWPLRTIAQNLVNRSLVGVIDGSFRALNVDVASETFKDGLLKEAWLYLEKGMSIYANTKADLDQKLQEKCHHCRTYVEKAALKRCSRCKYALYCSPACQIARWNGHKERCSVQRQLSLRLGNDVPTRSDIIFTLHLAMAFTLGHARGLRSWAAQSYPGVPLSQIAICVSFIEHPGPSCYALNHVYIPAEAGKAQEVVTGIVRAAQDSGHTLLQCITPAGKMSMISTTFVHSSIWDDDIPPSIPTGNWNVPTATVFGPGENEVKEYVLH